MTAEERIEWLEDQLNQALEQVRLTQEQLHELQDQLTAAHKRIEELEKQKSPLPAFVKANVAKPQGNEKKERKKRDAKHNHGRR